MRFSILMFNSNQGSMAVGLPLKICEIFFAHRAWKSSFCQHQSQSIHRLKVGLHLVGTVDYNFVADGYKGYGSIFIRLAVAEIRTIEQTYHW